MTEDLRIPKRALAIEFRDVRSNTYEGRVFVAEVTVTQPLGERVSDLLDGRTFLPVKIEDSVSFFHVRHIAWIRMDVMSAFVELDAAAEGAEGLAAGVRVEFLDGETLEGGVRYLLPQTSSRLGDFLEQLPNFFSLRTSDWLYLVNREHVVRVHPVSEVIT